MGKTFVEKIFGKAVGRDVHAGEIITVKPDYCLSHENAAFVSKSFYEIGVKKVFDPEKLVITFDHMVPASTADYANTQNTVRQFVQEQRITNFYDYQSNGGICHQIMIQEGYALPGLIILGTDSHTCTAGAMGAFATGIGRPEMAAVWATGKIWLMVPKSIRVWLTGFLRPNVTAKDVILTLVGDIKANGADYMSIEFDGPGIASMSIDERMTLCNMGIEMGAKNAVCRPDEKVFKWAKLHGKRDNWEAIWSDKDAVFEKELHYDLGTVVPCVAKPHKVDNYATVSDVLGTKIDQAFLGTCTNARIHDMRQAAAVLNGRHVAVRTIVIPASVEIYKQMIREGLAQIFLDSGCSIGTPGCGPCIGVYGGCLGDGETVISTANRNFKGRNGSKTASIYLASPITVAYSALYGKIGHPDISG